MIDVNCCVIYIERVEKSFFFSELDGVISFDGDGGGGRKCCF